MTASVETGAPFVMGVPEQLFRLSPMAFAADGLVSSSMLTGPWLGEGADPRAGTIGVLVDDVMGYAINGAGGSWSVSTQISVDLVGPIPADGTTLYAEGRSVWSDATSAMACGRVVDASGRVLAYTTERGRYIEHEPAAELLAGGSVPYDGPLEVDSLVELLGVRPGSDGRIELSVAPSLANPLGMLHGGMSFCLSEWAAALALPDLGITSSVRIHHLRPGLAGEPVVVSPTIEHVGRSLGVARVEIVDARGRLITRATVTRESSGT